MPDATTLLPSGFRDVLPPEAAAEADVIARLLAHFASFGYQRVKPPLLEFEESLLSGPGANLATQTFRVMDPLSRRMMGIRADMTPQIARIASVRLAHKPRPLRLSYSGQVIRVQGEGLHADRQLAQAGIELIGDDSVASDVEAAYLALTALGALGIEASVDFCLPRLARQIMEHHGTPPEKRVALMEAIRRKDALAMMNIKDKAAGLLSDMLFLNEGEAAFKALSGPGMPPVSAAGRLRDVIGNLRLLLPEASITLDPLDSRGLEGYHDGVGFSFFSTASRDELGRGGRYRLEGTGDQGSEDGVGFTLSVTAIKRALGRKKRKRRIYVPHGVPYGETEKTRAKAVAIHGLAPVGDAVAEARRLGCDAVWRDGEITPA